MKRRHRRLLPQTVLTERSCSPRVALEEGPEPRRSRIYVREKKHDPSESVWLAPFESTGAALIMATNEATVKPRR